ncbi:MAG: hypothetical protein ACR2MM_03410 [Flavobacteriaceae bacterium]
MYKNKFLIALVVAVLFASCKTDDKLVDEIFATVTRGAIVRTISLEGGSWNVVDDTETITIEMEAQDEQDGALLREVRVYADLVDNTGSGNDPAEVLLQTLPASVWEGGVWGLPRTTFSTSLAEVAAALGGLQLGDYNCGDQFNLRLELELTDGRMWTNTDLAGTVSGGSFFASPLNYRVSLIVLLPSDTLYTGMYQLTQTVPGIFGVSDYSDGIYQIDAIDNVTRVIRNITTFPAFGGFGPVDHQFQFVCNEIIMLPDQSVGAGCGGTIFSGPADVSETFDPVNPDDSDFDITFTSDTADDCGTGTAQATINLVKQ